MKKISQQLIERYAACPVVHADYVIDGRKFTVTRHFTGEKDVNKLIYRLAESHADREIGLN